MESTIFLNNINCGGCVSSIKSSAAAVSGVEITHVDIPTGEVTIVYNDPTVLNEVLERWDEAGYPEK